MAVPDPEDHDAARAEPGGGAAHREPDTDAAFAAIVAQWRTEPGAPQWPADTDRPDDDGPDTDRPDADRDHRDHRADADPPGDDPAGDLAVAAAAGGPPAPSLPAGGSRDPAGDDGDHFVPPDPPPFPVPRPRTVGGVAALALGVLLLAAPGLLGLGERTGTPLGLLVLTGAIGWLVLGLRSGPPPDSGWDDGARL